MTVASDRHKCVEGFVESDVIETVHISCLLSCLLVSVALEGEVCILVQVLSRNVIVLDSASAFNRTDGVAFAISEAADGGGGELERRFSDVFWIPVLSVETIIQVPHVDESILMRRHKDGE